MAKKILFVYRTPRRHVLNKWQKGQGPDSLLFGANHLKDLGYKIDFFDNAFSLFNLFHPLFYPLEHAIIDKVGMGFKLDQALFLLPRLNTYDVIVGTGDSAGLPLLALKHFGFIKRPIIFMTAGLAGALRGKTETWVGKFYKKILPVADVFTSYSQVEIDFFEKEMGIKKSKIKYVSLCTDFEYFSQKSTNKKTIISAVGVELGRDYKTFFEAVKNLPVKVEIACHPDNIKGLSIPSNVKVNFNILVQEVLKIYQRSILTVIPCVERYRSSGQVVLLEAASAGLPIIASEIKGLTTAFDFDDGKHLLYVKSENPKDLGKKIKLLLNNPRFANYIAKNSQQLAKKYSTKNFAFRLSKFIENLV